jgi:Cu/Ag efflux pump CusA
MNQINRFSEKFTKRPGFARSLAGFHIPKSQYLLDRVELPINEIEDLWGIAFCEAEEGTSLSAENCWFCRQRFNIHLRLGQEYRNSIDRLKRIPLNSPEAGSIPLSAVTNIRFVDGPPMISSGSRSEFALGIGLEPDSRKMRSSTFDGSIGRIAL